MPNHKFSVVIPLSTTFQPERRRGNVGGRRSQGKRKNYVEHSQFRWLFIRVKCHTMRVLYKHICVICKCVWMFFFFFFMYVLFVFSFLEAFSYAAMRPAAPSLSFSSPFEFPHISCPCPVHCIIPRNERFVRRFTRYTKMNLCKFMCITSTKETHTHTHMAYTNLELLERLLHTHTHRQREH